MRGLYLFETQDYLLYHRTMNDNETYTFENREYVSPTISRDEQMGFIDTLRQTGQDNISRINQDTRALGSQVDPMYGGFSNGTQFEQRYVTPKTNSIVADLKTAAQQTALNQALNNLQNQYTQRYKEAYRDAKVREYNDSKKSSSGSNTTNTNNTTTDNNINENTNTVEVTAGADALSKQMFQNRVTRYLQQGLNANEAFNKAQNDFNLTYDEAKLWLTNQ